MHTALVSAFGEKAVCPARVNDQLSVMSRVELCRYKVFSGHFDWTLLDCLPAPKYVFTILRDPVERILSFYFYLRGKASNTEKTLLERPENQGLKAALELSPRDYFIAGPPQLRVFIDDHYDNFYTYYFAARHYQGRRVLNGLKNRSAITENGIFELALDNMSTLNDVFSINNLQGVFRVIAELGCKEPDCDTGYLVNQNKVLHPKDRMDELRDIGGTDEVTERLAEFCRMDKQIWARYM